MKNYPYIPKSNKKIKVGDYWIMELSDKSFSVGIVIDIPPIDLKLTREIIAGVLNWNDKFIPNPNDLLNTKILEQGHVHIKTIIYTGEKIIGNIDLTKYNIDSLIMIDTYGASSDEFHLMKGYKIFEKLEDSDGEKYKQSEYWGYDYIKEIAENVFVKKDKNWL